MQESNKVRKIKMLMMEMVEEGCATDKVLPLLEESKISLRVRYTVGPVRC